MNNMRTSRPVAIWLMAGVFMVLVQALLGGITRLTGSGLSITQWDVVTGVLPPLSHEQWLMEFHRYQGSPQYRLLNSDFTLSDFKFIFFWEWFHRFWGRAIGLVFAVPFVLFLVQRRFRQDMIIPLIILFLLGALQGAVGWIMVASGLVGDAIYVNPVKLAMHFFLAMILMGYTFWFGLQLLVPRNQRSGDRELKWLSGGTLFLLAIQLIYGALMAGNKAAPAAATWPSINGMAWPAGIWQGVSGMANLVANKITIHFIHRGVAYLIFGLLLVFGWVAGNRKRTEMSPLFRKTYWIPVALVLVQVLLGIFTVLDSPNITSGHWGGFEWLAQLHQVVAMFLVLSVLYVFYLVNGRGKGKG
jgi:cytochrome c oxidase assembly protein subunit 15